MTGTDMDDVTRSLRKFPRTRRNFRSGIGARSEVYQLPTLQQNDVRPDGGAPGALQGGPQLPPVIDGSIRLPQIRGYDETDGLPITIERKPYRCFDLLVNLVSICSFLFDIGSDIYLCLTYYRAREFFNFALTLAFIAVPSLTMTCFSLRWYVKDYLDNQKYSQGKYEVSCIRWFIRCLGLILQIGPVIRYADAIYYGIQTWRTKGLSQEYYYTQMLFEDADSCLLRLIECTMESGPQLVLQLYIMATQGTDQDQFRLIVQTSSCGMSLVSLAWSVTSYTRALRYSRDDKLHMTLCSLPVHFLWQIFMAAPRVIALAMFAVQFSYWVFLLIVLHWLVMTLWLIKQQTHFTGTKCEEVFFNAVVGAVYVLCYLNVKEGRTRHKYVLYYVLTFMENAGMIVSWYFLQKDNWEWYHLPALVTVLGSPFAGLLFMQMYYFCCHPAGEIQVCLSDTASIEPSASEMNEEGPRDDREIGHAHFADEAVAVPRPVQNHRPPEPVNQNQNNVRDVGDVRDVPDARHGNHVPYQPSAASIAAKMDFRNRHNNSPFAFRKTDEQMGNIEIAGSLDQPVDRQRVASPVQFTQARDVYGSHSPVPRHEYEYQSCTVPRSMTYHPRDSRRDPRDVIRDNRDVIRDPRDVMDPRDVIRDPRDVVRDPRDPRGRVSEPRDVPRESRVREPRPYPRGVQRESDVRVPRDEYGWSRDLYPVAPRGPAEQISPRHLAYLHDPQEHGPGNPYHTMVTYDQRLKPPWNQRISQQIDDFDHKRGAYCDNRADNGTRV